MLYNLEELLNYTSSYIFYKNGNQVDKKEYKVTILPEDAIFMAQSGTNVIYMPFKTVINDNICDIFKTIENTIKKGVRAFFFDEIRFKEEKYYNMLFSIIEKYKDKLDFVIMSQDTMKSLFELARYTLKSKFDNDIKVIAVTGSVGKTSTTEMIYAIFKEKFKTYRGEAMINLRFRINLKIIEANPDTEVLLFECSGANAGYPKIFSELLTPDAVVITKVGTENLGIFKSLDGIAEQKCGLLTCLHQEDTAVLNDSEEIRRAAAKYKCQKVFTKEGDFTLIRSDEAGSRFVYKGSVYDVPVVGVHQINNAMKAIEVARAFNIPDNLIKQGLKKFQSVGSRWVQDKFNGALFITDCPNNPSYETMLSCISTFINLHKNVEEKRIAISGIRMLGAHEEKVHLDLAKFIAKQPIKELICLEKETKTVYEYIKKNAPQISVKYYDKPNSLNKDEPFVQYIASTLKKGQVFLMKGQGIDPKIRYEDVRVALKQIFK